jgi:hypothetical protein
MTKIRRTNFGRGGIISNYISGWGALPPAPRFSYGLDEKALAVGARASGNYFYTGLIYPFVTLKSPAFGTGCHIW